jgi:hypothetical protein
MRAEILKGLSGGAAPSDSYGSALGSADDDTVD